MKKTYAEKLLARISRKYNMKVKPEKTGAKNIG